MGANTFTVIALPHSLAADARYHVSVFVGPQLVPDAGDGVLEEFDGFVQWAALLRGGAHIVLSDQDGVIEAMPLLDQVDPQVWDAVFPPTTPVRGPQTPDLLDRHWRTFSAAAVHDGPKLVNLLGIFSDASSPPAPLDHPLSRLLANYGSERGYDESYVTSVYDQILGEPTSDTDRLTLAGIEERISGEDPFEQLIMETHRTRRFFERPEAQRAYQARPTDGETPPKLDPPEPDFHERCALASDHPALQRTLGLVIDLQVTDPERLLTSKWLSATIESADVALLPSVTRTECLAVGEDLVSVPRTADWHEGKLVVGDRDQFALLDVDPDGTGLKFDRYLWGFPRLMISERNGDPETAAPPALRSVGFTVVRHKRGLQTQQSIETQNDLGVQLLGGDAPLLATEDVTQGMRVEVWDDTNQAWWTLHARRIRAEALGHGEIVAKLPEEGFIQGATLTETPEVADSPVHVHEALFGWAGWSLSAPRPGKRVRHEAGEEIPEDPHQVVDPVTPLIVTSTVEPGSLPRLRYGRRYAFRAWAVDLAGNSRPHTIGPLPPAPAPLVDAVKAALTRIPEPNRLVTRLEPTMRNETAGVIRDRRTRLSAPALEVAADLTLTGDALVDRTALGALRARRGEAPLRAGDAGRGVIVNRAFEDVVLAEDGRLFHDTDRLDASLLAQAAVPDLQDFRNVDLLTITPTRPFLRWDPVLPPAMVTRQRFTEGESLRQIVIRSGVTQDHQTLDITVIPPDQYGAAHADHDYAATSERHLVPPKTSQPDAELHGAFDDAIGSANAADHLRLLAVALRESGTLFDMAVPSLADPNVLVDQEGIRLDADPGVVDDDKADLPLELGDPPAPGQYIVHDTDQLHIPYLPDVLARGLSFVFPEAGEGRTILFPFGTEGFTTPYSGAWPEIEPYRLVLAGSGELSGRVDGNVVEFALPPADVQRFRLASSLQADDLDLFGWWNVLPPILRDNPDVINAAIDGWLWAFTPFDRVTLVHAVPRPLEAPRRIILNPFRVKDSVEVALVGAIDIHGPSTDSVTAEATWSDPIDDLSLPAYEDRPQSATAFTTEIQPDEDLAILWQGEDDRDLLVPGSGKVRLHRAVHQIGDTLHHEVTYRLRAATRFREYFHPDLLTPDEGADPLDDGQSVIGEAFSISIPSSAPPAPPVVHSVLPLFRWSEGAEAEQPVGRRSQRLVGVRIYLERPWFSSGVGELVGVLLATGKDTGLEKYVSQWGSDPVWVGAPVPRRAMSLELDSLLHIAGLDDRPRDAGPVTQPAVLPLHGVRGNPNVTVLGYEPQYSLERSKWYVDIAIDPGSTMWPFVRLGLARYQPDSLPGCHLSAPTLCDFVQLPPPRTMSVSRTDARGVRVVVSGPIGIRDVPAGAQPRKDVPANPFVLAGWVKENRTVVARLQRRDPDLPTDLGWETVDVEELIVRGHGRNDNEAAWVGELTAPDDLPLATPGDLPEWRVAVEEWERLLGDPAVLQIIPIPRRPREWESRLVYADEMDL